MPIETGSLVAARGERWLLTAASAYEACTVLTLEGRDRANAKQRLMVIEPFERSQKLTAQLTRRPRRAVLRAAVGAVVDARSRGTLWTAAAAAVEVWPYQLEPALAAINGATRLLLADAVGLGKTIQAGLLLSELRERGWIERALIVCPAGLRETWARELEARFGIAAVVLDQASITERLASLPPGVSPWSGHRVAIASIDFIKRPEVLAGIEAEPIDLLIADEAHHFAPGTDRGAAISRLAARATWCVLLSATPHSGDAAAFEYLARLGAHDDPLAIFRRSRRDVGLDSTRRSHLLRVRQTHEEAALAQGLEQYARAMSRERGRDDRSVGLIAITLQRRAASSSTAILRTLSRRRALLEGATPQPVQPLLPWDDEDHSDDVEADALLAIPGLQDLTRECAVVGRLIELSRACGTGSKFWRLARLLDRIHEPVVVFTEYRATLEAITNQLRPALRVAAIHGGMPAALRQASVDAFNDGRLDVLVATDAAGEGLNLHHRCRVVIDMELPWNPLRLEQRVGRVDRLGQQRTVHAIHLFHQDSIEQQVLDRLTLREHRAAAAFERQAAASQAIAEAARICRQRHAHHLGAGLTGSALWCAPRQRRSSRFVLVGRRTFTNELGGVIDETVEAYVARLPCARTQPEWRRLVESAWILAAQANDGRPPDAHDPAVTRAAVDRRIRRIRRHLAHRRNEHQSSLFDRRSEIDRQAREQSLARLDQALTRTQSAIGAQSPGPGRVQLIAAWPETHR